ncbi:MAG TPA: nucleotide sugar dehydrogenase [Thermoleophilaceae bacterium]|nr:nucleotide sugar dehydrogenase [Thermoleophilaceae bacterium]
MAEKEPIGVIGVGWVGLCTAACFAELGHPVYARDILPEKVEALARGEVPMHEPGLSEMVRRNAERLRFTTDMREVLDNAELLFCCVDTPPTYSGDADLSRVEAVIAELGDSSSHAIVMKSTVPVGTGRSIQRRREGLGYVSNPEFLKEGTAVEDFMHPDRVVVGAGDGSNGFAARVAALYEPLGAPIVSTDVASAEMIKLASNAFLATKISFINEIANVSEELGADVGEVARGMGLDDRIGDKFLKAGLGYGGSCLVGDETVLVRHRGRTQMLTLERLWERLAAEESPIDGMVASASLEVMSWLPGGEAPVFLPVMCVTRRDHDGTLIEVSTKMGRRVRCTPDHPWVVADGQDGELEVKLASELTREDWIPLAQGVERPADGAAVASLVGAAEAAGLSPSQVIVRPRREHLDDVLARSIEERRQVLGERVPVAQRAGDVKRTGLLRLDEVARAGMSVDRCKLNTAKNGAEIASEICLDRHFWRVAGLYIAEGHATVAHPHHRLSWFFHREREDHLVDEVAAFWLRHGLRVTTPKLATSRAVKVSSRLLTAWWTQVLGMGRNGYEQRLPDLIWDRPDGDKWALLSGLFEGDGSWSLINGGPSVIIEMGTVSDELADGVLRLLGDLGIAASRRTSRTAKSTKDTHWIRISGAEQVERAIELVPVRDRLGVLTSIGRQAKRIAATGYRQVGDDGPALLRVTSTRRERFSGPVYSLEVPLAHTFVTSGGLISHNCFPKDVSALKQLAGNSGYHFQLLTSVIEVNDLQKRRAVGKLQKHLGSLVGKEIALLGVSFKPDTDDVREATSLVLAARLQGEGAHVRVYDPVALDNAEEMLGGARVCASALDAVDGADAVVLVTEWPEFAELDWAGEVRGRMAQPVVVDGRNFLDREALRAAGFTYEGIGR